MIRNNNGPILWKLALREMKTRKKRRVAGAVILTTALFSLLFTLGLSVLKAMERDIMRRIGTTAHGAFKRVTPEEMESLKGREEISQWGVSRYISTALNPQWEYEATEIHYYDDNSFKWSFIEPPNPGSYPEKAEDLLIDEALLSLLDPEAGVGDTITLSLKLKGIKTEKEFQIKGVFKGDPLLQSRLLFVSRAFTELYMEEKADPQVLEGQWSFNVLLDKRVNLEKKLIGIAYFEDLNPNNVGVNYAYGAMWSEWDLEMILPFVFFILLITLTGYSIIHSVIHIDIVRKIKHYGLLKSVGATGKQIKGVIRRQIALLTLAAIPVGVFAGYGLAFLFLPGIQSLSELKALSVELNPLVFLLSALFSVLTVIISSLSPLSFIKKLTAVEAFRYSDTKLSCGKKLLKSGSSLWSIALKNLVRSGKKGGLVILSLSLCLILLNTVYIMVKGFNEESYVRRIISSDFTAAHRNRYLHGNFDGERTLTEGFIQELKALEEVESVHLLEMKVLDYFEDDVSWEYIKEPWLEDNDRFHYMIYSLDERELSWLLPGLDESLKEDFFQGNSVIFYNYCDIEGAKPGVRFPLNYIDGFQKEYEILSVPEEVPLFLSESYYLKQGAAVYMSESEFQKIAGENEEILAFIHEREGMSAADSLAALNKRHPSVKLRSRDEIMKEYKQSSRAFSFIGYFLAFFIGFIALLNYINLMAVNLEVRKEELALFQCVGMTHKQMNTLLLFEGFAFLILTLVFVLFPGSFISSWILKIFPVCDYKFTVTPLITVLPFLALITGGIPLWYFRQVKEIPVVERLKNAL